MCIRDSYNTAHTHPMTDLAVIWYMTDNHGLLKIRNPVAHQRWNVLDKLNIGIEKSIHATAGDIVVFPADIEHEVESHELREPRICLSFNVDLDWQILYNGVWYDYNYKMLWLKDLQ